MINSKPFSELVAKAQRNKWCTKLFCTTCSSVSFREELRAIPREEVIEGLRQLNLDFIENEHDMFVLTAVEIAHFPTCIDLIEPLKGTPAGEKLASIIEYKNKRIIERAELERFNSPEATALRKASKKTIRLTKSEVHAKKQAVINKRVRPITELLDQIEDTKLLDGIKKITELDLLPVLGGMYFQRLSKYYRCHSLSSDEIQIIKYFADIAKGHWTKLFAQVTNKT